MEENFKKCVYSEGKCNCISENECFYTPDEDEFSTCNKCGSDSHWEECWQCGGEGGQDGDELMEEDPLWYGPDDFRTCDICKGKGGFYVCLNDKCKSEPACT